MDEMNADSPRTASKWIKGLLGLTLAGLVGAFILSRLPDGAYSTDLSRIGNGRPAVVLAQDSNYVGGMGVMELMNVVRTEHEGKIEFLVAPLGMTDARAFADQHAAGDGTVLLFAADGRAAGVLHHPRSAAELRAALAQAFGP
jgi:hypothetical protein